MKQQQSTKLIRQGVLGTIVILATACSIAKVSAADQTYPGQTSSGSSSSSTTTPGSNETENKGQLTSTDFKFVSSATEDNQTEITLGQLAAKNGSDPSVRDFGSRMVTDHSKVNQDLAQLIGQKGASVGDTSPGMKDRFIIKHLQGLNGPDFDKAYIKRMVADHKEDIKAFQKEAEKGDDADVKNFASKTLPALQEHLQMAESIESKISAPTASN